MSYSFKNNQFVIEDYDKKKTFSSFLPGIAGIKGIPLWAFYANRGQGLTSFGIRDKDEPILEFFPANTSYQYVSTYGFRSFVKVDDQVFEPFSVSTSDSVKRNMYISRSHFTIEEINETKKITYKVTYFGLANEPVAGLVRKVEVINTGQSRYLEVVDGIANILPSGTTNSAYKEMSNLMRSWMGVENLENAIPFYKFRASSGDEAEVSMIDKGHFYLSFSQDGKLIKPIVDRDLIFAYDTSLALPVGLMDKGIMDLDLEKQVLVNKVPCGFSPVSKTLNPNETLKINTIIGHVSNVAIINEKASLYASDDFIRSKYQEAQMVIDDLVRVVDTETNFPMFDAYLKQNFLDNTLRGGFPMVFGKGHDQKIYHVFSRKHGDPERDYNFFSLSPEFYSQGNGNFRDVNQNRRNDVFFVPQAGLFNIKTFYNLIQLDGYNPLGVQGTTFTMDKNIGTHLVETYVKAGKDSLLKILSKKFTPGMIAMTILIDKVDLLISQEIFMDKVLSASKQHIEAVFGEGFWVDHFSYNFDLIENYLSIYPDNLERLLYDDLTYQYYDSPVRVLPRSKKYGLTQSGQIRQYGSLDEEEHSERFKQSNWLKRVNGDIYKTSLFEKMMTLVLTKFSALDPFGMGIEMEANKPGWNDAMNGLPGMFGSGISEAIELFRIVEFLRSHVSRDVKLLKENYDFLMSLNEILSKKLSSFERWDQMTSVRETFREITRENVSGEATYVSHQLLKDFLDQVSSVIADGLLRAKDSNDGLIPTYIAYKVSEYKVLEETTPYGLKAVEIKAFEIISIPNFLEAPARSLKIGSKKDHEDLHHKIKNSDIYDLSLKTYKTSGNLENMSYELGRIRAFTPGWLERESNFLHMTYKYLLGLIKGGLYDAFYEEIDTNLVCFMNPETYGRSTLENSSFIASSVNPDPNVHGRGYVARLSGSTAEFLSIWNLMMFGKNIFTYRDDLVFSPSPVIHHSFFKNGFIRTKLLSEIEYVIENKTGLSTYDEELVIDHYLVDGMKHDSVKGDLALAIRNKKVKQVTLVYKKRD
ncbi:cellobiose phosphorylase [Acidaminobacter sp. JC074]|uniref:cellobiose phosphorylase n=1 Tax=Acidaminobacter sp. JC074 TaxID=2530199 RepID=UPI001F110D00|nr:cellobiose phosphorylase [Acidaminobacter sp. JC074]MCH4889963.1 cellobiose phosphorylase [Acidaminobacter sp. JC074]